MQVVIYGASSGGKKALKVCKRFKLDVILFIDRDINKNNTYIDGIKIISLNNKIAEDFLKNYLVIMGTMSVEAENYINKITNSNFLAHDLIESLYHANFDPEYPNFKLDNTYLKNCKVLSDRIYMLQMLTHMFRGEGVFAEIGVDKGDYSQKILDIMKPKKLYLIDIWNNEEIYNYVLDRFKKEIESKQVILVKSDSQEALKKFPDKYFDWVYLDSNHNYETPKGELSILKYKMKSDGIISGHDYGNVGCILLDEEDVAEKRFSLAKYGVVNAVNEFCIDNNYEMIYLDMESSYSIKNIG